LGRLVLRLHNRRQHEPVIAVIESALLSGQSQPWMYDVLALSMKITGRPKAQIERVLLSRIDFTGNDVPSMIYSAAHLTRFEAQDQALALYRQASRIAPSRPEPYLLGLKLARRQKDYDAVRWASVGILTTVWTGDYARLHRQAENAALDAMSALRAAGHNKQADDFRAAMRAAHIRDLVVKLSWSGAGDLDLIVEGPHGTVCSNEHRRSAGGGILVHDGFGPDQKNCFDEYICARGVPGRYRVRIRHTSGRIVGKRALLTVVRYGGTPQESVRKISVALGEEDRLVRISLPRGRRRVLASVPQQTSSLLPRKRTSRRSLIQMVGRPSAASLGAGGRFSASGRRAFVTGVRPTTGAGAVGFTPTVTLLPEGVSNTAMAIISGDRRYVRISVAPLFSTITDVFTFSFINSGGNPVGNPGLGGGNGNRP